MTAYSILKHIHLTAIAVSLGLFMLRGIWMLLDSPRLRQRWVRILPHAVDTILLVSALGLAWVYYRWPLVMHGWITAKILALLVYIVLGTIALKRGRTKAVRAVAWLAALLTFGYIVRTALTKYPWPF